VEKEDKHHDSEDFVKFTVRKDMGC